VTCLMYGLPKQFSPCNTLCTLYTVLPAMIAGQSRSYICYSMSIGRDDSTTTAAACIPGLYSMQSDAKQLTTGWRNRFPKLRLTSAGRIHWGKRSQRAVCSRCWQTQRCPRWCLPSCQTRCTSEACCCRPCAWQQNAGGRAAVLRVTLYAVELHSTTLPQMTCHMCTPRCWQRLQHHVRVDTSLKGPPKTNGIVASLISYLFTPSAAGQRRPSRQSFNVANSHI
jgi:hypothetical protein